MRNQEPAAFPVQDASKWQAHGMTLRDYFAAQAMIGLMGYYGRIGHNSELLKREIAEESYETADAMMAARERA